MEDGHEYVVKEGDTLSEILYNMTGDGSKELYDKIAKDNDIADVNHIVPGQKIIIGNEYLNGSIETHSETVTRTTQETADDVIRTSSSTPQLESEIKSSNPSDDKKSLLYESEDQDEFEKLLSKGSSNAERKNISVSQDSGENEKNLPEKEMTNSEKELSNTSQQNATDTLINNSSTSTSYYVPSEYEICYPLSVTGFSPRNSFKTFIIKKNAGEHFVKVNNLVKKCGTDIDGIITSLNTLKNKMGENTGTTNQIDKITKSLTDKKQDLITKNTELIEACYKVIEYVYENKESKSNQASEIYNTISQINLYKG